MKSIKLIYKKIRKIKSQWSERTLALKPERAYTTSKSGRVRKAAQTDRYRQNLSPI